MFARGTRQRPRTIIGLFLEAMWLSDDERQAELRLKLNGGRKGWNDQEPAVSRAACEIGLYRLWPKQPDPAALAHFVHDINERVRSVDTLDIVTEPDLEALILRVYNPAESLDWLTAQRQAILHMTIAGMCKLRLGLEGSDVTKLVIAAEDLALQRGFHPPFAS